jgi:hypothetical protein
MLWETKYAMPYLVIHIVPTAAALNGLGGTAAADPPLLALR